MVLELERERTIGRRARDEARWERGVTKVRRHVLHIVTNAMGDDPVGKRLRHWTMVRFGASMGSDCHIHGGSFFGRPERLHLGNRVFINRSCYFDLDAPVVLDDDVVIGHGVSVVTANHQIGPRHRRAGGVVVAPVHVEPGAWIGANATILGGVTIGRGAVVGAGAVVTADVEADTVVGGVPARVIRRLD